MNFNDDEKLAVLSAMDGLIKADNNIHIKEVDFLEAVVDFFNWNPGFLSKIVTGDNSLEKLNLLNQEKKEYLTTLLTELAASDKIISDEEQAFINKINSYLN